MKIAVAMCTYNGAAFLEQQLESLVAQTRLPDELVVCDDASTDGQTPAILHAFAAKSPFPVRVVENHCTLGSNKNFEKAIGLCDADVISLSDQDDVWHERKLQRFEEAFLSFPLASMVFCDADLVDETLQPMGLRLSQSIALSSLVREQINRGKSFRTMLQRNFVSGNALAFRARFKPLVLPVPTDLSLLHDGWIASLLSALTPICYIDEPLILYRQHAHQQNGASVPVPGTTNRSRDSELLAAILAMPHEEALWRNWKALHRRLKNSSHLLGPEEAARFRVAIALLERKFCRAQEQREHFQLRADLSAARLKRVPIVARELRYLRYQRHSSGILSALKDVFLR